MTFKFKDLKKLAKTVNNACSFAEQIKNRVHEDLTTIESTKSFIGNISNSLETMKTMLEESEKTLRKLQDLLD